MSASCYCDGCDEPLSDITGEEHAIHLCYRCANQLRIVLQAKPEKSISKYEALFCGVFVMLAVVIFVVLMEC